MFKKILEQERDKLKEYVNMAAIAEYKQREKEYKERLEELDAVTAERYVSFLLEGIYGVTLSTWSQNPCAPKLFLSSLYGKMPLLNRNTVRGAHEDARRKRLEEFLKGFGEITLRLKEMYQMITLGGDAEVTRIQQNT